MRITQLLSTSNFLVVNKDLCRKLGIVKAVVLSELCSEYEYYRTTKQLTQDGKFFCTRENMYEQLGIGRSQMESAYKELVDNGLITITKEGLPCKTYFQINETAIDRVISDEIQQETTKNEAPQSVQSKEVKEQAPQQTEAHKETKKEKWCKRLNHLCAEKGKMYTYSQIEKYYDIMQNNGWKDENGLPIADIPAHCAKCLPLVISPDNTVVITVAEKLAYKRMKEQSSYKVLPAEWIRTFIMMKFNSIDTMQNYVNTAIYKVAYVDRVNQILKQYGDYDGHRWNEARYNEEKEAGIPEKQLTYA